MKQVYSSSKFTCVQGRNCWHTRRLLPFSSEARGTLSAKKHSFRHRVTWVRAFSLIIFCFGASFLMRRAERPDGLMTGASSCNFILCRQRRGCVENAMNTLTEPTDVTVEEYVTDRFLCSRGSSGYSDAFSCKGVISARKLHNMFEPVWPALTSVSISSVLQATPVDPSFCKRRSATSRFVAAGAFFFFCQSLVMCCHMDDRPFCFSFFQVGVLSWGITDVCQQNGRNSVPPHARDFHIDLFQILPWLKQHLGKDVQFLPEISWSHKITSGWISSCLPKKALPLHKTLFFYDCSALLWGAGSCWIITQPTILILNITIFISVFRGDERLIYHKIKWNIWQKTSIISSISCYLLDLKKNQNKTGKYIISNKVTQTSSNM